MIASERKPAI